MPELTRWLVNWRCAWCGGCQPWWRALWRQPYCKPCQTRLTGGAGIYLQAGGPDCPFMSRAEPHHSPGAALTSAQRPTLVTWWRRILCQHCYHLDDTDGAWCCECSDQAFGFPPSPCIPCGAAGRAWMEM